VKVATPRQQRKTSRAATKAGLTPAPGDPAADAVRAMVRPNANGRAASVPALTVRVGRQQVTFSNLHKVLYPQAGFTKGEVVEYYLRIAGAILPHLKHRALTLKRYPNSVDGFFFYEKNCPSHRPPWVDTANVETANRVGGINFCLANDAATLAWVANLASLELHTALAKAPKVVRPTMMVFDFDPGPPADILDCCRIAIRMRDRLSDLGLQSFAKTSGSKGLHFYVPLNTARTFDDTKAFSHAMAMLMEREEPQQVTSVMRKDLRAGKVFIDWSQNDEHKTTVCAYSLRARAFPTVSTPVTWAEVEAALSARDGDRLRFEAPDVIDRVRRHGDLFAPVLTLKQKLPKG
jgi:bifunctional non-homologous end joining protein LigD